MAVGGPAAQAKHAYTPPPDWDPAVFKQKLLKSCKGLVKGVDQPPFGKWAKECKTVPHNDIPDGQSGAGPYDPEYDQWKHSSAREPRELAVDTDENDKPFYRRVTVNPTPNCGNSQVSLFKRREEMDGSINIFEVRGGVEFNILAVKGKIELAYQRQWHDSVTHAQQVQLDIPPWQVGWIEYLPYVWKDDGYMRVRLDEWVVGGDGHGHGTYYIPYEWKAPVKNTTGDWGQYRPVSRLMTAKELKELCGETMLPTAQPLVNWKASKSASPHSASAPRPFCLTAPQPETADPPTNVHENWDVGVRPCSTTAANDDSPEPAQRATLQQTLRFLKLGEATPGNPTYTIVNLQAGGCLDSQDAKGWYHDAISQGPLTFKPCDPRKLTQQWLQNGVKIGNQPLGQAPVAWTLSNPGTTSQCLAAGPAVNPNRGDGPTKWFGKDAYVAVLRDCIDSDESQLWGSSSTHLGLPPRPLREFLRFNMERLPQGLQVGGAVPFGVDYVRVRATGPGGYAWEQTVGVSRTPHGGAITLTIPAVPPPGAPGHAPGPGIAPAAPIVVEAFAYGPSVAYDLGQSTVPCPWC